MDFSQLSDASTLGLESAGCLVLIVIAWKIYKMKIHSRSGCCGDSFLIETMNRAGSSRDLKFTEKESIEKNSNAVI